MANSLGRNIRNGEIVIMRRELIVDSITDLRFKCDDGFGMNDFTSGTALFGVWLCDGQRSRMSGYEIDKEATEKYQQDQREDPEKAALWEMIEDLEKLLGNYRESIKKLQAQNPTGARMMWSVVKRPYISFYETEAAAKESRRNKPALKGGRVQHVLQMYPSKIETGAIYDMDRGNAQNPHRIDPL